MTRPSDVKRVRILSDTKLHLKVKTELSYPKNVLSETDTTKIGPGESV